MTQNERFQNTFLIIFSLNHVFEKVDDKNLVRKLWLILLKILYFLHENLGAIGPPKLLTFHLLTLKSRN